MNYTEEQQRAIDSLKERLKTIREQIKRQSEERKAKRISKRR